VRLLLVESDEMIAETILESIRDAGYAIDWARDGRQAELCWGKGIYDLVLFDLGTPGKDGGAVLNGLRHRACDTMVLILTARDLVNGLIAGADDCLIMPFDLAELATRVRALLRRRAGRKQSLYIHRAVSLDPVSQEVRKGGETVALTPPEFELLHALIEEPTHVFTKIRLEERLSREGEEVADNAIEAHLNSLRRKIGSEEIVTIRGVGYRLKRCE